MIKVVRIHYFGTQSHNLLFLMSWSLKILSFSDNKVLGDNSSDNIYCKIKKMKYLNM